MDARADRLDLPTAELLLNVRTPAELALSPDGERLAFALHATVADEGSFQPSDLFVTQAREGAEPARLTEGAWSDRTPAWSPDGTRLGFLSDRITPGHQLPYTMTATGEEPALAATLVGSAESVAWSSDGARLLVLAADPGSYGLDWSARTVNGAAAPTDPVVRRPGDAHRRLFLIDLASGTVDEVGPPELSVWEVDWDGDGMVVAVVSGDHSGSGWYQAVVALLDLDARTAHTLYEPVWQMEGLALSPDGTRAVVVEGYASDHGLLAGSLMRHRPRDGRDDRPLARPPDRRARVLVRRRFALVRPHRRHGERLRPGLAGRSSARSDGVTTRSSATPSPRRPARSPTTPPTCGPRTRRTASRPSSHASTERPERGRDARRSTSPSSRVAVSRTCARSGGRARAASRSKAC